MASLIWGSYARLVAKPVVAVVVIVSVLAINIGLIVGSEMWNVPLATEISKLWIDPASSVARNNELVETFSSKVDGSFNELVTLGNADNSNMLTSESLQRWEDYMEVVLDTIVEYNGTTFTVLDICNGRLGQSPYLFGCSLTNPIDYFSEGGLFHPSNATAQFLLDTKLAYYNVTNSFTNPAARADLWAWAMTIDSLSFGATDIYSNFFTKECLTTKKLMCGNNTQLYGQITALISAPAPTKLKFQLAWAKSQLLVASMLGSVTAAHGLPGSCDTNAAFDAQTPATTLTEAISFAGDTALLSVITPRGYQDGLTYSFSKCATTNLGTPCSAAQTCTLTDLQNVGLFNFTSPCASCVMAGMYWSGDAKLIKTSNGPAAALPIPTGLLSQVKIYDPASPDTAKATAKTLVIAAAEIVKATVGVCNEVQNATALKTDIPASNCTYLWDQFVLGTVAGLSLDFVAAKETTVNRAGVLARLGNPMTELAKLGYTKALMDDQWRAALVAGALKDASPSAEGLIRRHAARPSFKNKNTTVLGKILSGFKNDLLTQNLKGAIFGSAEPATGSLHGGKCSCNTGFAGSNCSRPLDLICDCDTTLKPTCMTGLLDSCVDLAPCGGFDTIAGLVAAAPSLGIPPGGKLDAFQTFPQEMVVSAAFFQNSTFSGLYLASQCKQYVPCIDSVNVSTLPYSKFVPSNYKDFFGDASYNFALVQDLAISTASLHRFDSRASLFSLACLGLSNPLAGGNPSNCVNLVNSDFATALGYTYTTSDVGLLGLCTTGANCTTTSLSTPTTVLSIDSTMSTACPITRNVAVAVGGASADVTLDIYWKCYAESRHKFSVNHYTVPRSASSLWSNSAPGINAKVGGCAIASGGDKGNCTLALSAFLMVAANKSMETLAPLLGASPALLLPGFSVTTGTFPDFDFSGAITSVLTSSIYKMPAIYNAITQTVFPLCQNATASCPSTRGVVTDALNYACEKAKSDFPYGGRAKSIEKNDCLVVLDKLPYIISPLAPAAVKDAAKLTVGSTLGRYKFAASVAGACSADGGVASGGGDCWEDLDCNSDLGRGTCGNLSDAVYLTSVTRLAAVTFSNSPEGTVKNLAARESAYRGLANKPIIDRYNAKHPGRRLSVSAGIENSLNLTVEESDKILQDWRKQMLANIRSYREIMAGSTVADSVTADSPTNLLDEISQADPKILILGYGMMLLYAFLACTNWSTDVPAMLNGSRALVTQAGIILVAISVASGLGVSHLLHVQWSAAATQIVPFVMLGLGVSDVFIMMRTFPMYQDGVTAADAAAKGLALAGPSMLLVTVTNAGVFAVGVVTAMPVVVNFALQAVIVCIANYLTVNTVLPALLILDYHRQAKGKMDILPCVTVGTSARAQVTHEGEYEQNVFNRLCVPNYNKCILSIPGKIFILALSTAFIASAIYGEEVVAELGLQLSDIAPVGSDLANALIVRDQNFAFYTMSIVSDKADWSKREVQQGIIKVFDDVMATSKVVSGSGTPWMKAFMAWGLPVTPDYNPYAYNEICDSNNFKTNGNCGLKFGCVVNTGHSSVVLEKKIPFYDFPNATAFYTCLNHWINSDLVFEALKPGFQLEDELAPRGSRNLSLIVDETGTYLPFSRGTVITKGLQYNNDFVVLIDQVRAVANADTVPPTFPIGEPIDFWDQYGNLRSIINSAVGYGLLICFLCIFLLLLGLAEGDGASFARRVVAVLWAASLTTGVIAMTVYEIYGYMAFSGLKISAIPAISIIMCTGVAVEYTAYITVQFVNAAGDRNQRAHHALMIMMAPTIDGAVTMFLGVVMLAASPFLFIVKYFFYPWLFIIGFGFFNGVAVLPVIFSLVGPIAINLKNKTAGESKDVGFNKV